jgi:hypothetical protein
MSSSINDKIIEKTINIDLKKMLKEIDDLEINIIKENKSCENKIDNYKEILEQLIFEHHNLCKKLFNK